MTPTSGPEARIVQEPRSKSRTEAQRDRDRILYSTSFRRLSGVTQVASPQTGQLLHSRLTHTLKVAQVARRMAERLADQDKELQLDPDVVETGALIHDLGHPPFGHIGEKALHDVPGIEGGRAPFEGNAQSFRIVTALSRRSIDYRGLNLTRAVLNAALKYPWERAVSGPKNDKWGVYHEDQKAFEWARGELPAAAREQKTLEAQIMDWADDVTYATHDLEDFFRAGLVPLDRLTTSDVELAEFLDVTLGPARDSPTPRIKREVFGERAPSDEEVEAACEKLEVSAKWLFTNLLITEKPYRGDADSRVKACEITSGLIGVLFEAATLSTDGSRLETTDEARHWIAVLKELTWYYVIERASLAQEQEAQRRLLSDLLLTFSTAAHHGETRLFPIGVAELIERARIGTNHEFELAVPRIVVDYISGMSEGEAIQTHRALTVARAG